MKPTIALFLHHPICAVDCTNGTIKALQSHYNFKIFTKHELEDNFFDDVDIVSFPGGHGDSDSFDYLLKTNTSPIKRFVKNGGKYLGICMGAYWAGKHYFNLLKEMIELNKNKIIKDLLKYLYSNEVNYDIYKFNGSQFYKINGINNFDNVIFSECDDFYKDKNGNQRKCAKMFYKLMVNNDIYRVEIRWKGNFSASPQFLCYLYDN
jgi:phosphoribosylformylglycinamidine (FGAM) synthase-like amidotransferase family enzyme